MARIEGYAYSDGTSKFRCVNSLVVEEQPSSPATTTARLEAPYVFSEALDRWRAILDATTPAGLYAITYSSTTRRVTIASVNGTNFRPVWSSDRDLAAWLGFDPDLVYGFATSHVGTKIPLGRADVLGVAIEPPEDAAKVEVQQYRLGRVVAPVFDNHLVQKVEMLVTRAQRPEHLHWLTTGRVRIYPTAETSAYSVVDLDGYVDGYVVEQPGYETLGDDEGQTVLQLLLALPRG